MSPEAEARVRLSVVIVSFNTRDMLRECLRRLMASLGEVRGEVLVADNASTDGSAEMVESEFPDVRLVRVGRNAGFAAGNNSAIDQARGEDILLLNSDALVGPGVIPETLAYLDVTPRCGILGVRLVSEDGTPQPSARRLPSPWLKALVISGLAARFPHSRVFGVPDDTWRAAGAPIETGWVPGAYFLIRGLLLREIGALDERYFLYFEETDFCLRAQRAGWLTIHYPGVSVVHLGGESSASTGRRLSRSGRYILGVMLQSEYRYYRKNYGLARTAEAAGVEAAWRTVVLFRNVFRKGPEGFARRTESRFILSSMARTLRQDRWGRGPKEAA